MSPSRIDNVSSKFRISPLVHSPDKKCNFGATVEGIDLNNLTDEEILVLREAIWTHKFLVVKDQTALVPKKNWELVTRLDPEAPILNQMDFAKCFHPTGEGILKKITLTLLPGVEDVHLMGKGYQGEDHYGVKNVTLNEAFSSAFHSTPLSEEDFENGNTRFQSWHMDGPGYRIDPPWFSSFRTIKLPNGPDQTVNWDDGSGLSMKAKPGRTAFFSSAQLYDLLTDEEKIMADHSWVEHMHHPYEWVRDCHGNPNGLSVACEGRETSMEEMDTFERDPSWTKKYPMVWVNPVTKEKSFQVQPNIVRKIFIRNNATDTPKVIDDLTEVRAFLNDIQLRILKPEYITAQPQNEGDMLLWDNYGMMHSRIDYPVKYGTRTAHQCWLGASRGPVGPVALPVDA
ncbi:uncharacterized protein RCO7_07604 [Rhynchosporium graminicola]|uniref:TauD/TfdA-like domain-containing protein n=1 Tax=Rhynchosporium graminicola TaxID=2792576 RepID=A0A1E1KZN7_9HELO|nr:uncharacterized protein RCO7_07604 [Rhynchosporium commune]